MRKPKDKYCRPMLTAKLANKNKNFEEERKQKLVKDKRPEIENSKNSSGKKLYIENGRSANGKSTNDASTASKSMSYTCGYLKRRVVSRNRTECAAVLI